MSARRHLLVLLPIVLIAALFRAWLIASDGVSFDSDEAIVGLMARHINQGHAIPTFYYGQTYMGSLDAILVAGGFRLLGESVHAIRIVQMVVYLLSVASGYGLAVTLTRNRRIAAMTGLLLAIPTPLGALYTTLTLGGYNELVLFGTITLWLGWIVTEGGQADGVQHLWRWAALGLAAGLGWWTNGAIVSAIAVVGLMGLRRFALHRWHVYALAGVCFLVGSAPWWVYNVHHDWAALQFLTTGFEAAPGTESISPIDTLLGLLILGLPAVYGLRYTWEAAFITTPGALLVLGLYLLLVAVLITEWLAAHRARGRKLPPPSITTYPAVSRWLWLVFGVFALIFVFSSFSDATGRYLMPLWVPAALGVAMSLDRLRRAGRIVPTLALGLLLVFQAGAVIRAAQTDIGLQPQLLVKLQTPAAHDDRVLDFLEERGYKHGYSSYWASFRLIFRSGESVMLDTSLPYIKGGYHPNHNRYPPYADVVASAERVVWISHNYAALDAVIAERLKAAAITYQTIDLGDYRVYYDFSTRVAPADLGLDSEQPLDELPPFDPASLDLENQASGS
ncbi:MAG: hypothetical protein GYB65_23255 [Chloroflexi bacterium]|nr:hypothetical protein [Chloroflexota bacterium]